MFIWSQHIAYWICFYCKMTMNGKHKSAMQWSSVKFQVRFSCLFYSVLLFPVVNIYRYYTICGKMEAIIKLTCTSHTVKIRSNEPISAIKTRSSATAEGPRDALSVKILSTVEASCTTNTQKNRSNGVRGLYDCRARVVNKLDRRRRRRVLLTTRSTCRGEIF